MEPFKVDRRIELGVQNDYRCPQIAQAFLKRVCRGIVEGRGCEPGFTLAVYKREVDEAIRSTSFRDAAAPGTGLPNRINQGKVNEFIEGPVILELVHLTDVGVSALDLERVRQRREHRAFMVRIGQTDPSEEQSPPGSPGSDWQSAASAAVDEYPRKRLKLFLSDGFTELQAIELERLPFELGITPMGTKVRLRNVPIVGGVAYLQNDNIVKIGGAVHELQKEHRHRLYDELDRRMDEDEEDALLEGISVEGLYISSS